LASELQSRLSEQIARLPEPTPANRRMLYEEARTALNAEIRAGAPFVSVQEAVKRRRELETAIIAIEREAARKEPPPEPKTFERKPELADESEMVAPLPDPPEPPPEDLDAISSDQDLEPSASESMQNTALDSRLRDNERDMPVEPGSGFASTPTAEAAREISTDAAVEQIGFDDNPSEYVPRRSAGHSLTLYAAVVLLAVGVVVAAVLIAGLSLDEFRGAAPVEKQKPLPELRLRTGPAGISPTNPAAELFKTAGFNAAAAGALKQGNALLARGEIDRAIAAFDDAIRLDPREPSAFSNRAFAYWRKGAIERAIGDYSEAITLDPDNPGNRLNRAIAYNRLGEYERAVADLDRVIVATPGNTEALNSRCWARAILKHLEEALADCSEANRLLPNDANILDSRGFVFLRLGRLDRAIADYSAALKIDPKLAGSLYGRGLARIGRGDRAGGAEDVTAARALDPGIQDTFARYGIR